MWPSAILNIVMYDLGLVDRVALAALGSAAERMIVQRWLELTFDHSHPEWRVTGQAPTCPDAEATLLQDTADGSADRLYHSVAGTAAKVLLAGGTHSWQFQAVRSHLLKDLSGSTRSFDERLRDLCPSSWATPPDRSPVTVTWRAESELPKHATFTWAGKSVPSGHRWAGDDDVVAGTDSRDGRRTFTLSTKARADEPLAISRAAARLQFEGSVAVDLARLTSLDAPLRLAPQIDLRGSDRMAFVRLPAMPRLQVDRMRRVADSAYASFRSNPDDVAAKQLVAGLRWLSVAVDRWNESPAMAGALTYIALDTAHNGCVVEHREGCKGDLIHRTALDRYVGTLQHRLADEIESYLLRVWGSTKKRARGRRRPADWMVSAPLSREGGAVSVWAKRLMAAMSGHEDSDPLLRFHLAELVTLHAGRLKVIRERCIDDLRELRKARNELVHDQALLLAEQRTAFLTSLAVEMLLLRLEDSPPTVI
jgi:hypothetical protein